MSDQAGFERVGEQPAIRQHRQMNRLARAALAVCNGEEVVSNDIFPPIPLHVAEEDREPGSIVPQKMNALYAFTGALYAQTYGEASTADSLTFQSGSTVGKALMKWNEAISLGYYKEVTPKKFEKLFFEQGLWKIFVSDAPETEDIRVYLDRPDFGGIRQTAEMQTVAELLNTGQFIRNDLPHQTSHVDACRFINTVLDIGFKELGLKTAEELERLVRDSLVELKQLALLNISEVNAAARTMVDPRNRSNFSRRFFAVDETTQQIRLNQAAILSEIDRSLPGAVQLVRRGCPVLFLKTSGEEAPVFTVMNETLLRIYRETGALTRPSLRRLER
jgi:hypothetical protein